MDVGRTNFFQMDNPTVGLPVACKPYPFPLKYQKYVNEEIKQLENASCIMKIVSLWAVPVITVPKKQGPQTPVNNSFI